MLASAEDLPFADASFSAVAMSIVFFFLANPVAVLRECRRVLRPGGKCFIAEPRFAFSASIPLLVMRLLARLSGYAGEYCEPTKATALAPDEFRALFATQPWASLETWRAGRYQYALGEKR